MIRIISGVLIALICSQTSAAMTPAEASARAAQTYADGQAQMAAGRDGEALISMTIACGLGETQACEPAGYYLLEGKVVTRNPAKAAEYFAKGCGGGDPVACFRLAVEKHDGDGIPVDLAGAAANYTLACTGDIGGGCSAMGLFYQTGLPEAGIAKDEPHALALYKEGCAKGNVLGCSMAGVSYISGTAAPCDYREALEWYQKAISLGETEETALSNAAALPDLIAGGVDCRKHDAVPD